MKAWNAQKGGAAAILVADDKIEPLITMDTPEEENVDAEYLQNISIPSALISKSLGDSIKKSLTGGEMVNMNLDWTEALPLPLLLPSFVEAAALARRCRLQLPEASETCYQTIRDSWSEIDKVASQPDGLSILSKKFKTCFPLKTASELKDYLLELYSDAAQYNQPLRYPINVICGGLDREASGSDILSKIVAGVAAYEGDHKFCYFSPNNESETAVGWSWQSFRIIFVASHQGTGKKYHSILVNKVVWNLDEEIAKVIENGVTLEVDLRSKRSFGGPLILHQELNNAGHGSDAVKEVWN
ncbi:hypothetical protein LWI29_015591 [Acer saccharum]|uniref:PA domain-containing protein n=1 Tax=Acer saccharum TaxID=4024 RepID=A0AA39T7E8_ACESA|nr:hypothetical protein LWI29_015591 [Acer saccharum]